MVRERRNWTAEEDALLKNAVELGLCFSGSLERSQVSLTASSP